MSQDILIRPPQLRSMAQTLRERAQRIRVALETVDNTINSLGALRFAGQQATRLKSRYQRQRAVIFRAPDVVITFAADLEQTAAIFEKADLANEKSSEAFIQGDEDSNAVDPNDIAQGGLGDCYFIAAIASIAKQNPDFIKSMIRDNGDGTYTVTLYKKTSWNLFGLGDETFAKQEITVTADFPTDADGNPQYARFGDSEDGKSEKWGALIEKAYAQMNNGYESIEGGFGHDALETLTGVKSQSFNPSDLSINQLADFSAQGKAVTLDSLPDYKIKNEDPEFEIDFPDSSDYDPYYQKSILANNHVYYLSSVNVETGMITLQNPWGWKHQGVEIPFKDFNRLFKDVAVNSISS